ncbi:MAG: hypothetical protein IPK07_17610 [Deltaproteobacteria bacterium]|nr:hypothetical protein [Deltaproteobacteria bacterium]
MLGLWLGVARGGEGRPQIAITGDAGAHSAFQVAFDSFTSSVRGWADVRDLRPKAGDSPRAGSPSGAPQVVFALGPAGLDQARRDFPDVPRVFALAEGDDCELAPRRGETGVVLRLSADDLVQALVGVSTKVHRIGYLASATTNPCGPRELEQALARRGLEHAGEKVSSVREGLQALRRIRGTVDAIVLLPNPDVVSDETVEYAVAAGLERRIPVVGFSPRITASGALFSVSLDPAAIAHQAAELARRALAGATPPPELPRSQRLTVNRRTARLLGIEVPQEILKRAAEGGGEP